MHKFLVIGAALISTMTMADTTAIVKHATPLLEEPNATAIPLIQLQGEEQVMIIDRQGGWYQVKASVEALGWLRLFHLQFKQERYQPDNLPIRELTGLVRGGHRQVTSSTGVRGLDKVSIANAKPDFEQLLLLRSYQQSVVEAQQFASQAQLQADRSVQLREAPR